MILIQSDERLKNVFIFEKKTNKCTTKMKASILYANQCVRTQCVRTQHSDVVLVFRIKFYSNVIKSQLVFCLFYFFVKIELKFRNSTNYLFSISYCSTSKYYFFKFRFCSLTFSVPSYQLHCILQNITTQFFCLL